MKKNENGSLERELGLRPKLHPMFDIPDDVVLHPENIAELLGVSIETVRRWCRESKLPNYSFGGKYIITGDDFKAYMRKARSRTRAQKELLGDG
jgi:excisionase family DNA binding protein